MEKRENILICPLNWGLGHASRCIPIITILEKNNFNVIIAAFGNAYFLLKKAFPHLTIILFNDYNINFPKGKHMAASIVWQVPRIFFKIFMEHYRLKKLIQEYNIDTVFSDNRFGLWNKQVKSVYITHQIHIKSPGNNRFIEKMLYLIHHYFIKKYDVCWVPDFAEGFKLAGELSDKHKFPENAKYIGLLSRFNKPENEVAIEFDLCVILSGTEPQRSIFENIVFEQLRNSELKAVVMLGKPSENISVMITDRIQAYANLSPEKIQAYIQKSSVVLARSGYSTLMDLATIGKKAILVPTPGQTEQIYLAAYLSEKNIFYSIAQDNFNLDEALYLVKNTTGIFQPSSKMDLERIILGDLL